jgi:hypothetical protein
VLQPLVITVMGEQLNNFADDPDFFNLSPPALAAQLKEEHINIAQQFHPTIMKFVYFGIGMLVANYISQALWIYTSEVLCRVSCLFPFFSFFSLPLSISFFFVLPHPLAVILPNHKCRTSAKDT